MGFLNALGALPSGNRGNLARNIRSGSGSIFNRIRAPIGQPPAPQQPPPGALPHPSIQPIIPQDQGSPPAPQPALQMGGTSPRPAGWSDNPAAYGFNDPQVVRAMSGAPQPDLAGGAGQQFGPNNNLIGTQLNPQASPDTQTARGYIGQNLGSLQQLPDRQALAQQSYDQLAQQSQPQFQQDLRQLGQYAAKFGRIGAGMTTNELGNVQGNREQYLGNLRAQLSTNAAGMAQQDQLGKLGASQGVYGQLGGQDQQDYANLTNERGYQQGLSQQAFQNNLAQTDQAAQYGMQGPNTLQYLLGQGYANQAQGSQQNSGELLKLLFQNQQQPLPAGRSASGQGSSY